MYRRFLIAVTSLGCLATLFVPAPGQEPAKILRAGIIGLDTSHVTAFTSVLNNPQAPPELAGVRVVAAYPGGSEDIPESKNRLENYTSILREKYQVEIV